MTFWGGFYVGGLVMLVCVMFAWTVAAWWRER